MNLSHKEYFYSLKKVHNILPLYYIDFKTNYHTAEVNYDDKKFECYLKQSELRHIDSDYPFYEVGILLTEKLNIILYR
jgi:hypothetical protein